MIVNEIPEDIVQRSLQIDAGRFLMENILARTLGMALPPYWHKGQVAVTEAGEYTGDENAAVKKAAAFHDKLEGLSDIELRTMVRENALGYPMMMPLDIFNPIKNEMWTLPSEPLVTLKGKNVITRRRVAKSDKRGTIKEYWTQDDYEITIQGILTDCFNDNRYPIENVTRLRQICEAKSDVEVKCPLFEIFNISRIAIEDFDLPFTKGESNQEYTIKAYSDDDFDLLIDKTALKQK